MIRKAQIKFIWITMSILLGVFSIIFGVVYHITFNFNEQHIEQILEDAASSYLITDQKGHIHSKSIIAEISTTNGATSVVKITFDGETFSLNGSQAIVNTALDRPYFSGKIGNVFYNFFDLKNGVTLFVATDATDAIATFKARLLETFFSLSITYLVLFILVSVLSKSVIKPIEEAFNKQKQFISDASHELKTPLSIISANADVLRAENDNKWVENIKSQSERMNDLICDMLSLAKINEKTVNLHREKFNISQEVAEVTLSFEAVAFEKNKNLEMFIQPDLIYLGDKQSIKKIINILLDNAIKHADNQGKIVLELKKQNGKTILSVFNTGSDVPAENSNKIFERFYRGDQSRSRESGGSGLGLSIAKSIADANNWKISASSTLGECMIITVVL